MPKRDPDATVIGENIRRLRIERHWTQGELASQLNVRKSQIGNYEGGWSYPSVPVLKKLSEVFGVSIDSLVYGDESPADRIVDKDLFDCFRQADQLDYRSKFIIRELIEGQVAKAKFDEQKKSVG